MSLNCYSPTKRRDASPKKSSPAKSPKKEKPYAALDETQRSHAYRYNIGNNFYREQVDKEKAAKTLRAATKSANADAVSEKSLPEPAAEGSPPGTTVTTFMMQMNQAEEPKKHEVLKLVPDTDEEAMPTDRALIEARKEAKLFRMMAQPSQTPAHTAPLSHSSEEDTPPNAPRQFPSTAVSHERKVSMPDDTKVSSSKNLHGELAIRKKPAKLFNLPRLTRKEQSSSISSTSDQNSAEDVNVPIPLKAAKILGTSNSAEAHSASSKWSLGLNRRKTQRRRANTTNSLPEKIHEMDENDITALPSVFPVSTSAEPDRNTSFEMVTRITIDNSTNNSHQLDREESDASLPPTPPAKDTPPHTKAALVALAQAQKSPAGMSGLGINTANKDDEISSIDFCGYNEKSDSAWFKHGAAEYAKLIEASPSMRSMQGSIVGSPTFNRHIKNQTLRPDGLRPDGLRPDGLTKEGYLPQTVYKPYEYSPSVYSTQFKTPDPNECSKKRRSVKPAPTLRTIADSPTPSNFNDPVKRSDNHVDSRTDSDNRADSNTLADKHEGSAESLPIVYRLSSGEYFVEGEDGVEVVDEEDPLAQFPLPPRASSLNWQKKPPAGARLSLIPSKIRQQLSISESSMITPGRVPDLNLPTMSANMRHDSTRASYDGPAEDKPAANDAGPSTNGTHAPHAAEDLQHGGQPSGGIEHAFQRSIGLTPYLAQQLGDSPNPISPGFNHPSAMPSPLAGPFTFPAIPGGVPSHEQLLTHFHVLHYHIEDTFRGFREVQKESQDEVLRDGEKKFNEMRSTMDEYFADVRSHLNAIEHNMGRTTGEMENVKNALDVHARSVDEHVYKPMRKLTNQNTELLKKVDSLQERIIQLEKKVDNHPPAYNPGDKSNGQGASTHNRPAMDASAPPSAFARPWGGYDAPRHMMHGQQQQQQDRQSQYTDVGGRYYNNPDASQHPSFQDGYYGNGSSYNYMRAQGATNGADDDATEELDTYEDLGDVEELAEDAGTNSCDSESSYRLVHSRLGTQQIHDAIFVGVMLTMFNRNPF
ncbi:hypothetical protein UCRNP2_2440 [Neofusicoccum parvum UCRNP2]|uniref:Uncharacterized protein n=1 Tax=Botryosphaeria parva (strain UCR-NP2) TaxID=1287680 RepID=R1GGH1_BOTPV|nr:hypothetical protein UCRNP2_2440 [Neofusicoccum parvum UCRNP2]